MIWLARILLIASLLFIAWRPARATCDPATEPDRTDIANARAAVAANCDCAGASSHGGYVRCAVEQANATLQNPACRGKIKRCAARSTCGKPGAVTCCRTREGGVISARSSGTPRTAGLSAEAAHASAASRAAATPAVRRVA